MANKYLPAFLHYDTFLVTQLFEDFYFSMDTKNMIYCVLFILPSLARTTDILIFIEDLI